MVLNRGRVLRASLLMLLAGAAVTVLVGSSRSTVQVVDDRFLDLMLDVRWTPLNWFFEAVSLLGATVVSWSLRAAAVGVLVAKRRFTQLGAFAITLVTSELCIGPVKALIDRPRPTSSLVETTGASFPSGHAIAVTVTAVGLVLALLPPGRRRLRWELGALVLSFAAALSRTYLGAHWLTDVVAGALIGGGLALLWPAVFEAVRARTAYDHGLLDDPVSA
ncbi:MAG: phosphatase PAP2 family protein [Acidimicrobiia bacterium]|nr:phosphatase PAP2 family protein [Acidimicrobiia bacterium]